MKSIKKISLFIVTAALLSAIFVGCEREDEDSPKNNQFIEQEIQFGITQIFSDNLKSSDPRLDDLPECSDAAPDHASITVVIDGEEHTFTPDVFEIDGQWYTEVFKLQVPNEVQGVTVTQFIIMDYDDNEIQATPTDESAYATFVDQAVGEGFTFTVEGIEKMEIPIEVLCYNEKYYADFGFYWFAFDFIEADKLYFFGDLCTKYFEDYAEYDESGYGLLDDPKFDLPAIIKVEVWDGEERLISYDNMYMLEDGTIDEPLAVYYPNNLDETGDTYTLKLYIRLEVGDEYKWVYYQTIHVNDETGDLTFPDGTPVPDYGSDEVVDFVVGECAYYESEDDPMRPDIEFAPYMNLPVEANITISHPYTPSEGDDAYFKVKVNNVGPNSGYDLEVATYGGWCADADETITAGTKDFYVYSSLYPSQWPECGEDEIIGTDVINKINHLYNFLHNNNKMDDYHWKVFQNAVWNLRGQETHTNYYVGYSTETDEMLALQTWDENYMPLPGGYAAVLLYIDCEIQLIFVQIDP